MARTAQALAASREVLRRYGNMSSATILFVLEAVMREAGPGQRGCAMAFGPGLTAETLLFTAAGVRGGRGRQADVRLLATATT